MDETLAAFADGRLDAYGRDEVITHLASCDECRAIYDMVMDAKDAGLIEQPSAPAVVRGHFGRNALIAALATAAAVTVVFFTPPVQRQIAQYRTGGVSELVEAAGELPQRDVDGRLAGGFPYKHLKGVPRSGGDGQPFDLGKVALRVAQDDIEKRRPDTVRELRASGLAHLLLGEREKAIAKLQRALDMAGGSDPQLLSDLAAAWLEQSQWSGNLDGAMRARDLAERSWRIQETPEAAWNRALAYQRLEQHDAALAAWRDYLLLDDASPWAAEVRERHIPALQERQEYPLR